MTAPAYRIEVAPRAVRELRALPQAVRRRVGRRILALARDPRPYGSRKLEGMEDLYRLRVGDYRVVYRIEDGVLLVLIVRVRHRRDAYRGV